MTNATKFTESEMLIIHNALLEILHSLDIPTFKAREEAQDLFKKVTDLSI